MYDEDYLIRGITYEKDELTQEEINHFRKEFLQYVADLVDYCATENYPSSTGTVIDTRERLELLAFCILSCIDGESGCIPPFLLIPSNVDTENTDPRYVLPDNIYNFDIAGALHDNLHRYYK